MRFVAIMATSVLYPIEFHYDFTNHPYLSFALTTTMIIGTYYFKSAVEHAKV